MEKNKWGGANLILRFEVWTDMRAAAGRAAFFCILEWFFRQFVNYISCHYVEDLGSCRVFVSVKLSNCTGTIMLKTWDVAEFLFWWSSQIVLALLCWRLRKLQSFCFGKALNCTGVLLKIWELAEFCLVKLYLNRIGLMFKTWQLEGFYLVKLLIVLAPWMMVEFCLVKLSILLAPWSETWKWFGRFVWPAALNCTATMLMETPFCTKKLQHAFSLPILCTKKPPAIGLDFMGSLKHIFAHCWFWFWICFLPSVWTKHRASLCPCSMQ